MTERDIELHRQAGWSDSKLIELVRADAMEAATRAANVSWSLMCKKMVELEREACANVCESIGQHNIINQCAASIRARGNT